MYKGQYYTIQSATNLINDAVLGTIKLSLTIFNYDKSKQVIPTEFLILRQIYTLPSILLGTPFMTQNGVQISFDKYTGNCAVYVNNYFIPIIEYGDTFTPAQQSPNLHQAVFTSTVQTRFAFSWVTAQFNFAWF